MKITSNVLIACLMTGSVLSFAGAVGAETVMTVKETGVAIIELQNIKMSDGTTVQLVTTKSVWMPNEGDTFGQPAGVVCHGMGKVTPDGVYSGDLLCDTTYSAEDVMTSSYVDGPTGGEWVTLGGTGKFKGANGSGRIVYTWGDAVFGDKITMTNEGTITLP
jgi:hypothetical protein